MLCGIYLRPTLFAWLCIDLWPLSASLQVRRQMFSHTQISSYQNQGTCLSVDSSSDTTYVLPNSPVLLSICDWTNQSSSSTALQLRCPATSLKRAAYIAVFFCIQSSNVNGPESLPDGEKATVEATMIMENGKTPSSPIAHKTIDTAAE